MKNKTTDRDTLISAEENRAMFDRIAQKYDLANRLISMGMDRAWRRKAIRALAPQSAGCYLDIGTGTGDLVLEILAQAHGAQVDGIDPAEEMLKIARNKLPNPTASFFTADATHLPMKDHHYDGIVSGFCFRNIEHRERALSEMFRVLKPDGTLVILEATYPANPLVRLGYRLYTPLVPLLGKLLGGGEAYKYLMDSIEDFPRPDSITKMFRTVGFENVQHQPLTFGTVALFSGQKAPLYI